MVCVYINNKLFDTDLMDAALKLEVAKCRSKNYCWFSFFQRDFQDKHSRTVECLDELLKQWFYQLCTLFSTPFNRLSLHPISINQIQISPQPLMAFAKTTDTWNCQWYLLTTKKHLNPWALANRLALDHRKIGTKFGSYLHPSWLIL